MKKYIPRYMTDKANLAFFLMFVAFYALIFIFVYRPFGSDRWLSINNNVDRFVFYAILVVLMGIAILTVSRLLMCMVAKKKNISIPMYCFWMFMEVALIAFAVTLFAWLVTKKIDYRAYFEIYPRSFSITFLILFIPYIISYMYFGIRHKEKELDELSAALNQIRQNVQTGSGSPRAENDVMVHFKDEKEEVRLSVYLSAVLYIESADNYVKIHYLHKGEEKGFILRNSLKNIEALFPDGELARCHRSYIVNTQKVRILRRTKDGLTLELDAENVPDIPVSKTYSEKIFRLFSEL